MKIILSPIFFVFPPMIACMRSVHFKLSKPTRENLRIFSTTESTETSTSVNSIPIVAFAGSVETGYLTWLKLTDGTPSCSTEGCNDVLSGPYSKVPLTDIPLSAIGFAAYTVIFIMSVSMLSQSASSNSKPLRDLTLFLASSMATFSGYLMFVITFILHSSCKWCYVSALLTVVIAVESWRTKLVSNINRAIGITSTAVALTAVSSVFLFYSTQVVLSFPQIAEASTAPLGQILDTTTTNKPPKLTKKSSPKALEIASKLKDVNAKMYGAFWCSHCFNQKQELGIEAYEGQYYTYIECDKEGFLSNSPLCAAKKVLIKSIY